MSSDVATRAAPAAPAAPVHPGARARPVRPHLEYLDGWRGLAIACLLVGHFFPVPGINFGALGVDLFFVLSGLLMAQLLFVDRVPLPTFYRRRIARIFPALFAMLALVSAAYAAAGLPLAWRELGAAALFINNYTAGTALQAMPFGHVWSLSVEEHSYVVLSLLALGARRLGFAPVRAVALCAALCAGAGIWYWSRFSGPELDFGWWLHSEVSAYGIFASALLFLLLKDRVPARLPAALCPALLAAGAALHWWSVAAPLRTIAGVGLFALALNLLRAAPALQRALSPRPLRQLGLWSFSIYLWQQPFYLAQHRAGLPAPLALLLGVGAGIASFYLLEQPLRRYLNTHWRVRRS